MDADFDWLMNNDARQVGFRFARYKFVAKMFADYQMVLEVGCGNKVVGKVVEQAVKRIVQLDLPQFDITKEYREHFDGVFMLDVFEHIAKDLEYTTLSNLRKCAPACIIGTPSIESQPYASAGSKAGHVNCVSGDYLRKACKEHWRHVFMYGMNDETLHIGFSKMSHYLIALCVV